MRLTRKRLLAMEAALSAALAGEDGEGDCAHIPFADLEAALGWVQEQIERRSEAHGAGRKARR